MELSEILEQHERGDVNVIIIAREHLPSTENPDARRLLARFEKPIIWREYKPEKSGFDETGGITEDSQKPSASNRSCFRICKKKDEQGWSKNIICDRNLFYLKLEDRLFKRKRKSSIGATDDVTCTTQSTCDDVEAGETQGDQEKLL